MADHLLHYCNYSSDYNLDEDDKDVALHYYYSWYEDDSFCLRHLLYLLHCSNRILGDEDVPHCCCYNGYILAVRWMRCMDDTDDFLLRGCN